MEFQFDLGHAAQPLYAAVPGVAFSLGNTEVAFHVHADGAVHVMSAEVERALAQCRQFRTLDEHVAAILQRNPALAEKRVAVQGVLEHLARIGVLVPGAAFVAGLGRDDGAEPAPLRAIVVRERGEASALAATLDSARAHEARNGTRRRWLVVGGAEAAEAVASARANGLDVAHVPPAADDADLGLLNRSLLLAAGARAGFADAGTRFDFRRHPQARDRLSLPRGGGLALGLAESAEAARVRGTESAVDPLAVAEAWCGRTLGAVVARGLALDAAGLAGHALGKPELDASTRVVGVDFAVRGAPRGEDAAFPYNLRGEPRDSLWRSREDYERQRRSPCLVPHPGDVQAIAGLAMLPFLLDGSALLPPTVGDDAAAERLFGALLRHVHPGAIVLRAADTVARESAPRDPGAVHAPALQDLLAEIAHGAQPLLKTDDPAQRLARYAMLVRDLGEAPARRRLEVLSGFVAHRRAAHLAQLQNDLEGSSGAPGWWTDALREAILATGRPLTAHTTPRLAGWPDTLDEAECTQRLGRELVAFAALCEAWPGRWARAAASAEARIAPA